MKGRIELGDITPHNLGQLKNVNSVIFPVSYTERFYKSVLESGELAKLAYFEDVIVGGVACRVDTDEPTGQKHLYIMTLGCLSAYRRMGIGSLLLEHVLAVAKKREYLSTIMLHVQVSNDDAIGFYKKHGFEVKETKKDYYQRIEPTDAHVLVLPLKPAAAEAEAGAKAD
mmetsp:Transcript_35358/g.92480  ORF Transcript_35358/g.92480 Transcript_35358/m.92480 type:complete len:170 (+) Transcript_35358:105-614(+)